MPLRTFTIVRDGKPIFDGVEFPGGRVVIARSEKQVESWDSEENMLVTLGDGHKLVWDKDAAASKISR